MGHSNLVCPSRPSGRVRPAQAIAAKPFHHANSRGRTLAPVDSRRSVGSRQPGPPGNSVSPFPDMGATRAPPMRGNASDAISRAAIPGIFRPAGRGPGRMKPAETAGGRRRRYGVGSRSVSELLAICRRGPPRISDGLLEPRRARAVGRRAGSRRTRGSDQRKSAQTPARQVAAISGTSTGVWHRHQVSSIYGAPGPVSIPDHSTECASDQRPTGQAFGVGSRGRSRNSIGWFLPRWVAKHRIRRAEIPGGRTSTSTAAKTLVWKVPGIPGAISKLSPKEVGRIGNVFISDVLPPDESHEALSQRLQQRDRVKPLIVDDLIRFCASSRATRWRDPQHGGVSASVPGADDPG